MSGHGPRCAWHLLIGLACLLPGLAVASPAKMLEQAAMNQLAKVQTPGGDPPRPFASDGCSGGLSAGWQGAARLFPRFASALGETPPWESCCVAHDWAYWRGEVVDGYRLRLDADAELRRCVATSGVKQSAELAARWEVSEEGVLEFFRVASELMYAAVRAGGGPCTGFLTAEGAEVHEAGRSLSLTTR